MANNKGDETAAAARLALCSVVNFRHDMDVQGCNYAPLNEPPAAPSAPHQQLSVTEIAQAFLAQRRILIASHWRPDPDALGSSFGLALALRELGLVTAVVNESPVPPRLAFMPACAELMTRLPDEEFDSLVICDCPQLSELGPVMASELLRKFSRIFNLDHHITNPLYGSLSHVRPGASSACEVVYDVIVELEKAAGKLLLTPLVAEALYAGVCSDTGSFKFSNTNADTFRVAADLVRRGANPGKIADELYGNITKASIAIQAEILGRLRFELEGKVAIAAAPLALIKKHGGAVEDVEGVVDRMRDIEGVKVAVLLREVEGLWTARLRSKGGTHDVSRIAGLFGGGGHQQSAGLRISGSQEAFEKQLLEELRAMLG